jgi:uncharacterized protein YyaL (SSP411 family)
MSALAAVCLLVGWVDLTPLVSETEVAGPSPTMADQSRRPNRLIREKSPYLRQHAYNPVDWFPWGDEAFAKARKENKPIFLSIGYSTCHWCHVMAHESFEDEAIARLMNESFVCIKVDREERPDVDEVYLAFVEAYTGSAGWPLTVLLTPDLKPFFGGTYFPPDDRQGRPGLRSIVKRFAESWKADRGGIAADSNKILAELKSHALANSSSDKIRDIGIDEGYLQVARGFDSKFGGFGGAPKFPRPAILTFLFQVYADDPNSERGRHARDMALFTLRKMAAGGIHDHIGGGFHRYAVDEFWRVPHFEKMLYDQAQLAESYLTAYQITRESVFAETARDILDFVRRDMTGPDGGFLSAEDADSLVARGSQDHAEGAFYVWTKAEIEQAIGRERAKFFDFHYGVEAKGNAPGDPRGTFPGENILMQVHTIAETAHNAGLSEAEVLRSLAESRSLLFEARNARPRPEVDKKVIAAWNGLMISAYSRGYQILDDPLYLESARRAAAFVEKRMYDAKSGILLRSYCDGPSAVEGFSDDYAFLVQGLLDLYEASFDVHFMDWAQRLQGQQNQSFWDASQGGYFRTTGRDASVLIRSKEAFDGAEPSTNSTAVLNLLRFSSIFDDESPRAHAEKTIHAFAEQLRHTPTSLPEMLVGLDWFRNPPRQIVIEGREGSADTLALLAELNIHFIPRKTLVLADGGIGQDFFAQRAEFFRNLAVPPPKGATAYVCENYVCRLPTANVARFAELLTAPK